MARAAMTASCWPPAPCRRRAVQATLESPSRNGRRAIAWISGCGLGALAVSLFPIGGLPAARAWFVPPEGRPACRTHLSPVLTAEHPALRRAVVAAALPRRPGRLDRSNRRRVHRRAAPGAGSARHPRGPRRAGRPLAHGVRPERIPGRCADGGDGAGARDRSRPRPAGGAAQVMRSGRPRSQARFGPMSTCTKLGYTPTPMKL